MALRGDPPRDQARFVKTEGGFAHATELVRFVRESFPEMGIGVAGYPEGHPGTPNRLLELEYLKQKVDAGADYICTQLFFDNRDFYDFCERCELGGIRVPILAGIMPITSRKSVERMAALALGSRYPARLLRALARAEDDPGFEKVGAHWATEQVRDLIDHGVRGVHFYTFNRSKAEGSLSWVLSSCHRPVLWSFRNSSHLAPSGSCSSSATSTTPPSLSILREQQGLSIL